MKICRIIKRILVYPFVLAIILISYNIHGLRNSILFLMHGGEWNTYNKDDQATIQDIYMELKKNHLTPKQ